MSVMRAVAAVLITATVGACSTPAPEPEDDGSRDRANARFVNMLQASGIPIDNYTSMIDNGRKVCDGLGHGYTTTEIARSMSENTTVTITQAGVIVNSAITAFCPTRMPAPTSTTTRTSTPGS